MTATQLNPETVHALLARSRRRRLLDVLTSRTDPIEVDELAERIAAREAEAADVPEAARRRVLVSLVHAHLPRLSEHGLVEYDPETRVVAPTDDVAAVEPHLEATPNRPSSKG